MRFRGLLVLGASIFLEEAHNSSVGPIGVALLGDVQRSAAIGVDERVVGSLREKLAKHAGVVARCDEVQREGVAGAAQDLAYLLRVVDAGKAMASQPIVDLGLAEAIAEGLALRAHRAAFALTAVQAGCHYVAEVAGGYSRCDYRAHNFVLRG